MTRSEEIKRLEQYAKGLGVNIHYRRHKRGDTDGAHITVLNSYTSEMVVFYDSRTTKTELILKMIHELGHHLSWVYRGRQDSQALIDALIAESYKKADQPPIPKPQRKLIYEMEKYDTKYWEFIITELGIKIKKNVLELERQLDIWVYRQYYLRGEFPNLKEVDVKRRQLAEKYAKKERA